MTSLDIKNYFNTHDWFKYFLLWEDENGNIHQDNRSYISAHGGVGAEHRWEKMAKKTNQNIGGTIDNEGTITTYIIKDILFNNLDKIANWITNETNDMLHITAHLENYNVAIYYTPTGERYYTYDYVLSLQKSQNAPLGFTFCGFSCTWPD